MASAPPTLVTGDAVVLDVQMAQLPVRAVSAVIDLLVVGTGYLLAIIVWTLAVPSMDRALASAIFILFTVVVIVGYPLVFETATRGRSLGKIAMGLRVVSDDGGPERFRQAAFRALAGFVEIWMLFGGPAVICSVLSPRGKRIGDIFAGTVVVSERGPKPAAPPVMPAALAWWAPTLDLSGLGPGPAEAARQFLARADQLMPSVREPMARQIAADVLARIAPPPPPGTPAEYVLAAVLAERHRREIDRLRPTPPPAPARPDPRPPPGPSPAPPGGGLVPPG
jgi:uncharacterized RDD family membrane protein YckC